MATGRLPGAIAGSRRPFRDERSSHAPPALPATALALLVTPTAALAATAPPVTFPDRSSLARSLPRFTWTPGPGGEVVNTITIRPQSRASEEESQTIRSLASRRSATSLGVLDAGTYIWSVGWSTAPGVSPSESGTTPDKTFTIPPVARSVVVTRVDQFREILRLNVAYFTNITRVRVTCRVLNGSRIVSTVILRGEETNGFDDRTESRCALRVPESLDGTRLRANVTVSSGRTTASVNRQVHRGLTLGSSAGGGRPPARSP